MFINRYKYTVFDIPDADNNTFMLATWNSMVQGRDGGWTSFGVCVLEVVEDEKHTPVLAILLIWLKQQKERVVVEMPEPGSEEKKVWGSDDYNNN